MPNSSRTAAINNGGTAQLNLNAGGQASSLVLGTNVGQSGTLQVSGADSLTTGLNVEVGRGGTGTVTVSGGGDVFSKFGFLGSLAGSTGTATVTGVGSTWTTNGGSMIVGGAGSGTLTIASGGKVFGFDDQIAGAAGSTGTATVSGAGSSWNSSAALTVGRLGAGTLRIENGATATSGSGSIGDQATGVGIATVTGTGSNWTVSGNLTVGNSGTGTLTISDGGLVRVGAGAGQVTIGNGLSQVNIGEGGLAGVLQAGALVNGGKLVFNHTDATTFGAAVSGSGRIDKIGGSGDTTLTNVSAFTGLFDAQAARMILQGNTNGLSYYAETNGTLRFSGGFVNLGSRTITATASGAIEYEGEYVSGTGGIVRGPGTHTILPSASATTFLGVTTYNSTNIVQNGSAHLGNFTNGGTFTSNAPLTFDGGVNGFTGTITVNNTLSTFDVGNSGVVAVNNGGAINNYQGNLVNGGGSRTTINSGGAINLLGGTTLELNGALLVNNGTVTGTVNVNYGSLAKGTGTYGVVNVNQGGIYSPGNSPGISTAASVAFETGPFTSGAPRLVMELGGTTPGTQYDQLHVTGALALGGTLDVVLVDLGAGVFAPHSGDAFDILDWGTLAGTFSSLSLPTLNAGLTWNTSQLYTAGILSVGLLGDYNANGVVDAADYVVWRKGLGTIYTQNDYNVWRANVGQPAGAGAASGATGSASAAVPEPATSILLGICVVGIIGVVRRRPRAPHL